MWRLKGRADRPARRSALRRAVRLALVGLCSAALLLPAQAGADDRPAPPSTSELDAAAEALIVEIVFNGLTKGEFTVLARANGDYLVAEEDLLGMGLQRLPATALTIDGRPHHSLRALGATALRFDETRLALHAELPPGLLPASTIDFQPGEERRVLLTQDNSAFFNYRLLHAGGSAGSRAGQTLATELGVHLGGWLLRSESLHVRDTDGIRHFRQGTRLSRDDRATLRRWTIGEFVAVGDELGSLLNVGGIGVSKSYQIDPYFIRQPMAGFSGMVSAPAEAEIYLDGVRIRTETLQPGPFELRNLNAWGGRRDLTVLIRDSFGREQRVVSPLYFSPAVLREGLHEYAYGVGLRRQSPGSQGDAYRGWVASALHRYGLNDRVTLGAHLQAETGRYHLGPTLALRSNRAGVLSGSLSAGRNPAGRAWAGVVRHAYQMRDFGMQLELRRQSLHYQRVGAIAETDADIDAPATEFGASVSHALPWLGNLSLGYRQAREHDDEERHALSLGLSRRLFGTLSLLASFERSWGRDADTRLLAALSYSPQRGFSAQLSHARIGDSRSELLQLGTHAPLGEGLGYRVVGQRSREPGQSAWQWSPSAQYNGRFGSYSAELHQMRDSSGREQQGYQLGVAGGVAWVGRTVALSRPITDSFASVEVGGLEGVRVYHSSELIGRTDARGRIFLPNLGSYLQNRIAVDDRDIPIEHQIAQKEMLVSPALRSGARVRFDITRNQTLTGRLLLHHAGRVQPAAYSDVSVNLGGRAVSFPTGAAGEFYIDGLKPGRHTARLQLRELRCEFELMVPESLEMLLDLGEVHACRPNP